MTRIPNDMEIVIVAYKTFVFSRSLKKKIYRRISLKRIAIISRVSRYKLSVTTLFVLTH